MSDERFTIKPQDDYWAVVDNYNDDKVCIINGIHTEIEAEWLCDFMNEQQALISALKKENKKLKKGVDVPIPYVENSMRRLRAEHKVDEQQATIRRLQDLCGESDGENAKLRIENKKLREERQRLIYHLNKEPKR